MAIVFSVPNYLSAPIRSFVHSMSEIHRLTPVPPTPVQETHTPWQAGGLSSAAAPAFFNSLLEGDGAAAWNAGLASGIANPRDTQPGDEAVTSANSDIYPPCYEPTKP